MAGRAVLPGFVDSHTHLVFAGDRSAEFAARMTGQPYDGGGIGVTVAATRAADDDELRRLVGERVAELRAQGTTTVEIKSGYGLTVADEVRALRIAAEFTAETTFLGAHVVPPEYAADRAGYVDLVTGPMLTAAAPYARWIDVFCEPDSPHAFDGDEARAILLAGPRRRSGAAGARQSARPRPRRTAGRRAGRGQRRPLHLPDGRRRRRAGRCRRHDRRHAAAGGRVLRPDRPIRTLPPLLAAGVSIALATDCNPGTCYSSSMPFMIALAVREMGLTPAQALYAATAGSARSLRRTDIGRLRVGARADLTVLDAPSYLHLAYRPGVPIARAFDTMPI